MVRSPLLVSALLLNLLSSVPFCAATKLHRNDHDPKSHSRSVSTRIVGGDDAGVTRFPYYTYLVMDTDNGPYRCGGTLIHPDIVMTAAHCYQELIHNGLEIMAITAWVNMTSTIGALTGYEYRRTVVQHMMHPAFDESTNGNDVALFKLNREVSTVPLPRLARRGRTSRVGVSVKAIGQGMIIESGMYASKLQVVEINVASYRDCNDWDSYNGEVDPAIMVCAGAEQGGKDDALVTLEVHL